MSYLQSPAYSLQPSPMDDVLVFAGSKEVLWDAHSRIEHFVRARLEVELKSEVTRVLPVTEGVPFLGFVVFPGTVRFDPHRARRWRSRMRALQRALDRGTLTEEDAQRAADSLIGWAEHGDTRAFRRAWIARQLRQARGEQAHRRRS